MDLPSEPVPKPFSLGVVDPPVSGASLPTIRDAWISQLIGSDSFCSRGAEGLIQWHLKMTRAVFSQFFYYVLGIPCRIGFDEGDGLTQLPFCCPGPRLLDPSAFSSIIGPVLR